MGVPGQMAYAHANGSLDDIAASACAFGTRTLAVQWCAIRGVGMHQEKVGSSLQWTPLAQFENIVV